ncbi:MAG: hypothetical protein Q4B68_00225 [Bacteroidales bacterium]|nr:hypothetical protein [Bacteroidales bacterium]
MKFDLDIFYNKSNNEYSILPSDDNRSHVFLISSNLTLANEVYNEIITTHDVNKSFTTEDFNEIIDGVSADSKAQLKKADFLLAVYNADGCFVAQTGKTRAIQVRPQEQEIVFDSRNLVLDIYSSKMKVSQLTDYQRGDMLLLTSQENVDASLVRRVLSNPAMGASEKCDKLKAAKECAQASFVIADALDVKQSFSMAFLKKVKLKYVGYTLVACAAAAVAAWTVINNPFKATDNGATVVDEDSIVTTKAVNNADTTLLIQPEAPAEAAKKEEPKADEGESKRKKEKESEEAEAPAEPQTHEPAPAPEPQHSEAPAQPAPAPVAAAEE